MQLAVPTVSNYYSQKSFAFHDGLPFTMAMLQLSFLMTQLLAAELIEAASRARVAF